MTSASPDARDRNGHPRPPLSDRLADGAARIVATATRAGALRYCRERHLGGLIGIAPEVIADRSPDAARLILARLRRALRAERRRARAGHWTYDINRHIALRQAYTAELTRLGEPGVSSR